MNSIALRSLLAAVAVAAAVMLAPSVSTAAPASEEYVLDFPSAGEKDGGGSGESQRDPSEAGSEDGSKAVTGIAADSASDGGLPILLVVLAGTAAAGAGIAIVRRRSG